MEDFELQPVDEGTHGFFFGGDSYVIKYTYEVNGQEKYIIYFWQVCGISFFFSFSESKHNFFLFFIKRYDRVKFYIY